MTFKASSRALASIRKSAGSSSFRQFPLNRQFWQIGHFARIRTRIAAAVSGVLLASTMVLPPPTQAARLVTLSLGGGGTIHRSE